MKKIERIGLELEFHCYDANNKRINFAAYLREKFNGEKVEVPGIGTIMCDAYHHQGEFAIEPCVSPSELVEKALMARAMLPGDWNISFSGVDPHKEGKPLPWRKNPRYIAIVEAVPLEVKRLGLEKECDCARMLMNGWYAATQVTLEIAPFSPEGSFLLAWLNNHGPALAQKYSNGKTQRLKHAWHGWTNPARLPAPHSNWIDNPNLAAEHWHSIPRLIKQQGDTWVPDLETPPDRKDDAAGGTYFGGVRERNSDRFGPTGVLEHRLCPSVPPGPRLEELIAEIVAFSNNILSGNFPEKRYSDEEWWSLFLE